MTIFKPRDTAVLSDEQLAGIKLRSEACQRGGMEAAHAMSWLSHLDREELIAALDASMRRELALMRRFGQKQKIRHNPAAGEFGDCHRTAIAILFGLDAEEVEHFADHGIDDHEKFNRRVDDWLTDRGFAQISIPYEGLQPLSNLLETFNVLARGVYWLLAGTSRTGCNHSVVCRGGVIIADPSQTNAGIIGPCDDGFYWATFLLPIDYAEPLPIPIRWRA